MGLQELHRRRLVNTVLVTSANTFIGNVSDTINTPALLAAKLSNYPSNTSFNESDIHNFTIIGSDIKCYIGINYSIKSSPFSNLSLTYYSDSNNFCKKIPSYAFLSQTALTYVNLEGLTSLPVGAFRWSGLESAYFPNVLELINGGSSNFHFQDCTNINSIYLPSCTIFGYGFNGTSYVPQPAVNNNCFLDIKLGCEITVPTEMQTVNSGGLEADLAYARDSRSAVMIYV